VDGSSTGIAICENVAPGGNLSGSLWH